jgi:ABC-2 type transport system permease protein
MNGTAPPLLWIAWFEFHTRIRKLSSLIYFLVFTVFSALLMIGVSGVVPGLLISLSENSRELANSPFAIHKLLINLNFIAVIILAAVMGQSVNRDRETRITPLIFTKPIRERDYVFGKFIGGFAVICVLTSGMGLGLFLGSLIPSQMPEMLGPFNLLGYIQPYLVSIVPTNLFIALLFFSLALHTRKMTAVYAGSIILFIGYAIAQEILPTLDNTVLASVLDPFGYTSILTITRYWTLHERNGLLVPLTGVFIVNRVFWIAIGISVFAYVSRRFSFSSDVVLSKKEKRIIDTDGHESAAPQAISGLISRGTDFGARYNLRSFLQEFKLDIITSVKDRYFFAIILFGILMMVALSTIIGTRFGMPTLPVTHELTTLIGKSFSFVVLIVIVFLSGELVWRDRSTRIDQVMDALPTTSTTRYLSKIASMQAIVLGLLLIPVIVSILLQLSRGFYQINIGEYLIDIFVITAINHFFFLILSITVQVILSNKYLGHFVMALFYIFTVFAHKIGLEHKLFVPFKLPRVLYSDMNGYGDFAMPFFWYTLLWTGLAGIVVWIGSRLYVRGTNVSSSYRFKALRRSPKLSELILMVMSLTLMLGAGSVIVHNTFVLNDFTTRASLEQFSYDYEVKYKKLSELAVPAITHVSAEIDIFPGDRRVETEGTIQLVNQTDDQIDSVLVSLPTRILIFQNYAGVRELKQLSFDRPADLLIEDPRLGVYMYRFAIPLQPGDTTTCSFTLSVERNGFAEGYNFKQVVENGTFLNSYLLFPTFRYNSDKELGSSKDRIKYDLPPQHRVPRFSEDVRESLLTDKAPFEFVLSTTEDQIAIAPGQLVDEWNQDGRNYYRYASEVDTWTFYTFQSARYAVKSGSWNDVSIEVYYHPEHHWNVDAMIEGVQASLDYYTTEFSPQPQHSIRIVEFPRYASFAISMPNTIPFSEEIGFIADIDRDDKKFVDYPFYITAHEIAHYWWGEQVSAAQMQGATLIDEGLAEYSALMVVKKRYGDEHFKRLMKHKLHQYMEGRAESSEDENPLYLVEYDDYLHYSKASVVFSNLAEYVGEEKINAALRQFLQSCGADNSSPPSSIDLLNHLHDVTPDSLDYMIEDLFERITLYAFDVKDAEAVQESESNYRVSFSVSASKAYADGMGDETSAPMHDEYVQVGIYNKEGIELSRQLIEIHDGDNVVHLVVDQLPSSVVIDPLGLVIEKNKDNNSCEIELVDPGLTETGFTQYFPIEI